MKAQWIAKRTTSALLQQACKPRKEDSHKGDYGKILLLCGCVGFTGAPALAAMAALRSGAGLIYLGVPSAVYPIVASKLDEPMVFPLPDRDGKLSADALPWIMEKLEKMDACLIGPGLGRSEDVDHIVCEVIGHSRCPLVLDADGINAVSGHIDVLREAACPIILTPHEGEFRRLTCLPEDDRVSGAVKFAEQSGCIVLRKGKQSIITDGKEIYIDRTGNPGMATGGSGDVLAGIVTSLLGQKNLPLVAAAAAAWIHGTCGDFAALRYGQYALTPNDLIRELPRLLP